MELATLVAVQGFMVAAGLLWLGCALAPSLGLVANPARLRFYDRALPVVGGAALALGAVLPAALALLLWGRTEPDLVYSAWRVRAITFGLVLAVLYLAALALRSDRRQSVGYELWPAVVAMSLLMGAYGATFDEIFVPGLGEVNLGLANVLITALWVVLVVAAVELLDSVPGAAPVVLALTSGLVWYFTHDSGEVLAPVLAAAALGASLALVGGGTLGRMALLGKSGNKVAGFVVAVLLIVARRKAELAQFVLLPLLALIALAVAVFLLQLGRRLDLTRE